MLSDNLRVTPKRSGCSRMLTHTMNCDVVSLSIG